MNKYQFAVNDKLITVYACEEANRPIIYLNTFSSESDSVYKVLQANKCPSFTLVSVGNINWNHDMSPWAIPPISVKNAPFTGGADDFIKLMTESIIPQAERYVNGLSWRGIAGYSLAGLFALYSLYRTDRFMCAGSMSGSLWFPQFKEYVLSHEMKRKPDCIYFSLGDKECMTANPYLKTVQQNTEAIEAFYKESGIDTIFQLNAGNHYKNAVERTASGILWLLNK